MSTEQRTQNSEHRVRIPVLGALCSVICVLVLFQSTVMAASQGPLSPGTMDGMNWNAPDNAKTSDSVYASWAGYGMAPSFRDNEIKIIKGGVIGSQNKSVGSDWDGTQTYYQYGGVDDLWGETWTTDDINGANFGCALKIYDWINEGFSQYLSATNFGFSIPAGSTINGITAEIERYAAIASARVDHIRITVYYTEGGGGGTQTKLIRNGLLRNAVIR